MKSQIPQRNQKLVFIVVQLLRRNHSADEMSRYRVLLANEKRKDNPAYGIQRTLQQNTAMSMKHIIVLLSSVYSFHAVSEFLCSEMKLKVLLYYIS